MAEDADQRTEQASPQKRKKLHDDGQIPRSADVGAAAVVLATCLAISATFDALARALVSFTEHVFRFEDSTRPLRAMHALLEVLAPAYIPMLVAAVAGALAGAAQSRTFSLTLLMPKPERFNPMPQLAQMVPSKKSAMEVAKQVIKLLAVGYIAYTVVRDAMPTFTQLSGASPMVSARAVATVAGTLATRVGVAFMLVAALDYFLARHKFLKDAMMSREEVRDEHKQEEGRPEVKQRIRQKMREMSKKRSVGSVAKATVLVVNPTHYAVALRYVPERDFAPMILAKGVDEVALAMRSKARSERIPIVEQRTLARALHASGKLGRPIPVDMYRAVAEVIAYVMQLRARDAGVIAAPAPEPEPEPAEQDEA